MPLDGIDGGYRELLLFYLSSWNWHDIHLLLFRGHRFDQWLILRHFSDGHQTPLSFLPFNATDSYPLFAFVSVITIHILADNVTSDRLLMMQHVDGNITRLSLRAERMLANMMHSRHRSLSSSLSTISSFPPSVSWHPYNLTMMETLPRKKHCDVYQNTTRPRSYLGEDDRNITNYSADTNEYGLWPGNGCSFFPKWLPVMYFEMEHFFRNRT